MGSASFLPCYGTPFSTQDAWRTLTNVVKNQRWPCVCGTPRYIDQLVALHGYVLKALGSASFIPSALAPRLHYHSLTSLHENWILR